MFVGVLRGGQGIGKRGGGMRKLRVWLIRSGGCTRSGRKRGPRRMKQRTRQPKD